MSFVQKNCEYCSNTFNARLKEVKRGYGRYCTRSCSTKAHRAIEAAAVVPNVSCSNCSKEFYKNDSKKKLSKSGHFFCCRSCKDFAQRIGGIAEIMPPHYGTGNGVHDYRQRAFDAYEHSCASCGWNLIDDVLEVHHKDRDRSNNDLSNLILLCPTCHDTEHYMTRSGKWGQNVLQKDDV